MPQPRKYYDRLAGRVAIVTGAGSQTEGIGTGRAISAVFAGEGAKVCLVDLEPARAEVTREMIADAGGDAFVCAGDITDSAVCAGVVSAAVTRYGSLDILVNNVGVSGGAGEIWDLDEARWDRMVELNLKASVLMTKHAMRHLIASGRGAIVNVSSISALLASGGNYSYGPAKAAMIAFSRDIAITYGRRGVRTNVVAPGHIFTPHVEGFFDDAAREIRRKVAPLGIAGDAWDVAAASLFLASEEARFITGVCIAVDGGATQTMQLTAHHLIED